MIDSLDLIVDVAPKYGGTCFRYSGKSYLTLSLPIELSDGRIIPYSLTVTQYENVLKVKESTPKNLPAFCPERHINSDGTFCLGFGSDFPREVSNEENAVIWFETLYKYLQTQARAANLRVWPGNSQWAHGDASSHQLKAMVASSKISTEIRASFDNGELTLRRSSSRRRKILEVLILGKVIFRIWEQSAKVINTKRACFCKSSGRKRPKRIGRCGDHALQAISLAFAIRDLESEEAKFWVAYAGSSCCNTCDACPLK